MRINPIEFEYDEIFTNCTNLIKNIENRKDRILSYKSVIDINNESYSECFRSKIEFKPSFTPFDSKQLTLDMIWLYDTKFAKKKSPGRRYYNDIKLSTPNERCPYCLLNTVRELDHYLPKSVVPVLSITPQNLVPVCKDCNFQKGSSEKLIPNPYFDNLDIDTYLNCNIDIINEGILVFSYEIVKPESMDNATFQKLNNLFSKVDILHQYNNLAQDKFYNDIELIKGYTKSENTYFESIDAAIRGRSNGFKKNTWEFSYYNALKENYDVIVNYLESK